MKQKSQQRDMKRAFVHYVMTGSWRRVDAYCKRYNIKRHDREQEARTICLIVAQSDLARWIQQAALNKLESMEA